MAELFWSIGCVATAFVVHVAMWRVYVPVRQTRALLLIFLLVPLAFVAVANCIDQSVAHSAGLIRGGPQSVQLLLLSTAFALAYIITYSAIEVFPPSLLLVLAVAAAEPEGISEAHLVAGATDDFFVKPRIADLVRDGMIVANDRSQYEITAKGLRFARIFVVTRAILGRGKGG